MHPEIPKEGKLRELRPGETEGELGEPLRSYAEEAELVMRRPSISSYSVYALEATEFAKEHDLFEPFHRGMYKAYWEHGKNIGHFDVIKDVAIKAGLDWPELELKLESRHYEESVSHQYQYATNIGIHGIPGFVVDNKYLFTGAQPYDVFKSVMDQVLQERESNE